MLLDLLAGRRLGRADGGALEVLVLGQGRIQGEEHLVPDRDVTGRLAAAVHAAGLEVPQVPDIVHRLIDAAHGERGLARPRQRRAAREDHVERHAAPGVALPPHAEVAREHVPQRIA